MIDLSHVRRYYVACGYTDLRRGIDGLAAIVTQQFGAQRKVEGKAALGYRYCTKLFTLEKQYGYATAKSHYEYRQNVVRPLLEEYFCWLKTVRPEKGSKLDEAVRYSLNLKEQLTAFLEAPEVPISNNLAENAIRPFVLGRKNWLFSGSVKGAESIVIVYSLVETAKANGVEPYEYLLLVLSRLPYYGKTPSHEILERLMPWNPDVRRRKYLETPDCE